LELEPLHPPAINCTQPTSNHGVLVLKADCAEWLNMDIQLVSTRLLLAILLLGTDTRTTSSSDSKQTGSHVACEAGGNAKVGKHNASEIPLLIACIPRLQQRLPSMLFLHQLLQPAARSTKHPVAPRSVASGGPCQSESCGKLVGRLNRHWSTTCVEQARH